MSFAGPENLACGSHITANFQPILLCLIRNFKLRYEDSENIKTDRVSIVVFNLHQIKRWAFNTIQYNTIQYNTIQYNTIQYNTIQYNTIQYNTIQYNTIQYNTIQYNTIQ